MADVTIHGLPPSSYTISARMTCWEKGISHDFVPVDLKNDAHVALHPYRKVPALEHGDFKLYETSAIMRYVDDAFDGPSLVPSDPKERAIMEQWLSNLNCYVYQHAVPEHILQFIFPKGPDGKPDMAAVEKSVPKLKHDIGLLNQRLEGRDFIAGDSISLADLAFAPIVGGLSMFPMKDAILGDAPNVMRWFGSIAQRESFQKAHEGLQLG